MDGVWCIIFKFSSLIVCLARIEFQVSFLKRCFRFPNDIFQGKASFLIRKNLKGGPTCLPAPDPGKVKWGMFMDSQYMLPSLFIHT